MNRTFLGICLMEIILIVILDSKKAVKKARYLDITD